MDTDIRQAVRADGPVMSRICLESWRFENRGILPDEILEETDPDHWTGPFMNSMSTGRVAFYIISDRDTGEDLGCISYTVKAMKRPVDAVTGSETAVPPSVSEPSGCGSAPAPERDTGAGGSVPEDPAYPGDTHPGEVPLYYGELLSLYILPRAMGRGCGTKLMNVAVFDLIAMGCVRVVLWVSEANRRARDFYEQYGFIYTGEKSVRNVKDHPVELVEMEFVY